MSNVIQSTEDCFIFQLKRAVDNRQDILVHFSENQHVVILGSAGKYHANGVSESIMASSHPRDYRLVVLSGETSEVTKARLSGRPLSELLWRIAYNESAGKLLPGCNRDDVIKLESWPNLTRLRRSPNICRIAALFSARPTSIELAARILAVPLEEMFQFYSAASYAGYTTAINRPPEVLRLKPHRRQSLIQKLMVRLTKTG